MSELLAGVGNEVLVGGLLAAVACLLCAAAALIALYHPDLFAGNAPPPPPPPQNDRRQQQPRQQSGQHNNHGSANGSDSVSDGDGRGGAGDSRITGRTRSAEHDCAVCLDAAQFAVETNCGHVFCGECMLQVQSQMGSPLSPPPCPYCRQRVTMLLIYFTAEERNIAEPRELEARNKIQGDIAAFNRRFSGAARSWAEHLRDMPVLLRHLWQLLWTAQGIHFLFRARILLLLASALLYVFLPFDIVPEVVFGVFGFVDDAIVVALLAMYASVIYRNWVAFQQH